MKKLATILLAVLMTATLAGCGSPDSGSASTGYAQDGYAEGKIGDTMHTYFFDYTVNSAYTCSQYETYTPSEGNELLVADVTIKNTFNDKVVMFDSDFQAQWGDDSDEAFVAPVTYYLDETETVGPDVLPYEYTLQKDESRTGLLVFEVPQGKSEYSISYVEYFDDDTEGDTFFVFFNAEKK